MMQGFLNRRRVYLLGALIASQGLGACVVLPLPYHRHRPHVVEPSYRAGPPAPVERYPRDYGGRRDRGQY
jgi:hypothetical protein